jgi:hypothetical protein
LLLSDSETLDEGFETQSNVSETVESIPRSCPLEIISNETHSESADEMLADELTRRLTFNSTRRSSHDGSIRNNNNKRTSGSNGRSTSLLKTSTSAYSYPTFTSTGQQNQSNNTFTKRTPSVESLRSTSTNNNNNTAISIRSSRHIQRCAVSRRIWNEKDTDETSKNLATSPPPTSFSTLQTAVEPDEVSSSSTVTTTTTTTNRRISSTKSKNKIRNLHTLTDTSSRSNSPIIRKAPSRLSHASSCQNVSIATTNSPKSSPLTKTRSPPSFFLNSSQIHRPAEKPLRAFHLSTAMHNESSSPRTRRLFCSNTDIDSPSLSSPKNLRKPPSSWQHQKPVPTKSTISTVLPSSNLSSNRKKCTSTIDLRKTTPTNSSVFQRLTQSKR